MNVRELRDVMQSAITDDRSRGIGEERDVLIQVPDGSGIEGNVRYFKLSGAHLSGNQARLPGEALEGFSPNLMVLEGEELAQEVKDF